MAFATCSGSYNTNKTQNEKKPTRTVFFLLRLVDDEAIAALHEIATFASSASFGVSGPEFGSKGRVRFLSRKLCGDAESCPVFAKISAQHDLLQLAGHVSPSLMFSLKSGGLGGEGGGLRGDVVDGCSISFVLVQSLDLPEVRIGLCQTGNDWTACCVPFVLILTIAPAFSSLPVCLPRS